MKPIRLAALISACFAACGLSSGAPKNRCAVDGDCLEDRICVEGICHDRRSAAAGASGGTTPGLPSGGSAGTDPVTGGSEGGRGGDDAIGGGAADPLGGSGGDAGGSGGGGGDAGAIGGTGGEAGAGAAGMPSCPEPPTRVWLPAGFCIDPHEVTRGAYDAWASQSPAIWTPPGCENNTSLEPSCTWVSGTFDLPANCIDWCDAAAYCQAHGARLCAGIGGGSSSFDDPNEPSVSEWFNACSADGRFGYPYGDRYDPGACNTEGSATERVGLNADCHAPEFPYSCVFDLSGNVREWEDSCDGDLATSRCRIRGGGYPLGASEVACTATASYARTTYSEAIGFRCCSDSCD